MKFMHLADLHLGKRVNGFSMLEDQEYILKKILQIVISIIMLIFAILMVYYGTLAAKQFWNYTWVNIPKMKRGPTWLCLPVCGATSALYLIGQIIDEIADLKKGGNE